MKNKKMILIAVAVVAVAALMLGVFLATRPETVQGAKTVTVTGEASYDALKQAIIEADYEVVE